MSKTYVFYAKGGGGGRKGPKVPTISELYLSNKKYKEHDFAQHAMILPLTLSVGQGIAVQHFTAPSTHPNLTLSPSCFYKYCIQSTPDFRNKYTYIIIFPLILLILQRNEFYYLLTLHSSNRYRNSNIWTTHNKSVFSTGADKYKNLYLKKKKKAEGVHPWTLTLATALPNLLSLHIFYCYTSFYCVYIPCLLSSTCFSCDLLPSVVASLSVFWSFIGTWSGKFSKTSSGSFLRFPQCWRWK